MVQTAPETREANSSKTTEKQDLDYVFYELTRSMCPECRRIIDGQIIIRDNKVYMRKRCPEHGWFEGLIYADAEAYTNSVKFNKPGTMPLDFSTEVVDGCPYDCGLCPEHKQHACIGIIEVNSACNFDCPLCFADAQSGFNLTLEEVDQILDRFIETEGEPEVVQFSGGEPSVHPQIVEMIRLAKDKGFPHVMLNTNGRRIARDDEFLAALADLDIIIYMQFDGFKEQTHQTLRAEENLLAEKKLALDRLHSIGKSVMLVPAIDRNLNLDEVGEIVKFALKHPAVHGINFQPVFHSGRHTTDHDPLQRVTNPDILQ
ncbi:MAG: radical SAM protein, partial [Dehalococcoidia bacterium]|nr:radical SAM protein [Dehalococcoidia bacterium]